jgi:hypothetical protein
MWNVKAESDTSNKWGNWNHLRINHTIPEQYTGKQEIKELNTSESTNVKVQNIFHA